MNLEIPPLLHAVLLRQEEQGRGCDMDPHMRPERTHVKKVPQSDLEVGLAYLGSYPGLVALWFLEFSDKQCQES